MKLQELLESKTITEILKDDTNNYSVISYSLNLLFEAKFGNNEAFNKLVATKDVQKFLEITAKKSMKQVNKNISLADAKGELIIIMYNYLKQTYHIYGKSNELFLFTYSMNKWINKRLTGNLIGISKAKNDLRLDLNDVGIYESNFNEKLFTNDVKGVLFGVDLLIFSFIFEKGVSISDTAKALNMTRQTLYKRLEKIKEIIKEEIL